MTHDEALSLYLFIKRDQKYWNWSLKFCEFWIWDLKEDMSTAMQILL